MNKQSINTIAAYMVRVQGRTPSEAAITIKSMSSGDVDALCSMIKDKPDDPTHVVPAPLPTPLCPPPQPPTEWTANEVLRQMDFGSMVWERQRLYSQSAALKVKMDELTRSIEAALEVGNTTCATCDEWIVRRQSSKRTTLDRHLLLQHGCPLDVITKSEVVTTVFSTTIRKRSVGDKESSNEQ